MQPGKEACEHSKQLPVLDSASRGVTGSGDGSVTGFPAFGSKSAAYGANGPEDRSSTDHRKASVSPAASTTPPTEAILQCFQALMDQPLDDKLCFDDGSKDDRDLAVGSLRNPIFGGRFDKDLFANPDGYSSAEIMQALISKTDFRKACTEAGLDELDSQGCAPDGQELFGFPLPARNFNALVRQIAAAGISGLNRSASGVDGDKGCAGRNGKDGGDAFLHPHLDGGLPYPADVSPQMDKLCCSTVKDIANELSDQAGFLPLEGCSDMSVLQRRLMEASNVAATQLRLYDNKKYQKTDEKDGGRNINSSPHHQYDLRFERLSKYLGVSFADDDSFCRAISGVGALMLFNSLSVGTLKKCCKDLGISTSGDAGTDVFLLPESFAEKISAFIIPLPGTERLQLSHVMFLPRLQVHEFSPGSYTCTIDNARGLGHLPLDRITSNRFTLNKIKWRCLMMTRMGKLHFFVWHRQTGNIYMHMILRTPEIRKRKGAQKTDNGDEKSPESVGSSPPWFVEAHGNAEPNMLFGVGEAIALSTALDVSETGPKLYNPTDDRLVLQLTLAMKGANSEESGSLGKNAVSNNDTTFNGQKTGTLPKDARAELLNISDKPSGDFVELSIEEKQQQELRNAVSTMCEAESSAREGLTSSWHAGYRQLQYAEYREGQQARLLTRERERKQLLLKVGPSPELHRDVEKYRQLIQTGQQQLQKLIKEKNVEEKENKRLTEKVAEQRIELDRLTETLEKKKSVLASVEKELEQVERRISEKKKILERRYRRRKQAQWTEAKTDDQEVSPHDALSINDYGVFLSNEVTSSTQESIFQSGPQAVMIDENFNFSTGGALGSSMDVINPVSSNPPPVFSTQPNLRSFLGVQDGTGSIPPAQPHVATPPPHPTPPLTHSPMLVNADLHNGSLPLAAFGTMGPSPFSTNPATHHSTLYGHANPAPFQTTSPSPHCGSDSGASTQCGLMSAQANSKMPVSGFTVTAGGGPNTGLNTFGAFSADPNADMYTTPELNSNPGQPRMFYTDMPQQGDTFSSAAW